MGQVWVNNRFLETSQPKASKWKPAEKQEKVLWGTCACGRDIYKGDSVGMHGDHVKVICYECWMTGEFSDYHCDCCSLVFPDATLSQ
jgi:hypothetical protein